MTSASIRYGSGIADATPWTMARLTSSRTVVGGTIVTAVSAIALALALPPLREDEGKRNLTYLDLVNIPTACYGHTGPDVKMGQWRSDAECEALLTADAREFMAGTARCVPGLQTRPYQWAASTRLAFNIGTGGFCGSTAARRFNAGNWRGGCDAFKLWRRATYARRQPGVDCLQRKDGKWACEVPGLISRRKREGKQCLEGLPA